MEYEVVNYTSNLVQIKEVFRQFHSEEEDGWGAERNKLSSKKTLTSLEKLIYSGRANSTSKETCI